jgi:hypothetical protein
MTDPLVNGVKEISTRADHYRTAERLLKDWEESPSAPVQATQWFESRHYIAVAHVHALLATAPDAAVAPSPNVSAA